MAMPADAWRECECLKLLERQYNLLVDCFYGAAELASVPLHCGARAREEGGEVIVEIAMPYAITTAEVEIGVRERELVVRYRPPEGMKAREFSVALWCDVDADEATAEGVGNVLLVKLPTRCAKTRRITVEAR